MLREKLYTRREIADVFGKKPAWVAHIMKREGVKPTKIEKAKNGIAPLYLYKESVLDWFKALVNEKVEKATEEVVIEKPGCDHNWHPRITEGIAFIDKVGLTETVTQVYCTKCLEIRNLDENI